MVNYHELSESSRAYYSSEFREKVIEELMLYADMVFRRIYIINHFDEYSRQLKGDRKTEYWDVAHFENLMDSIKISLIFENYGKAVLLKNGFVVHKIRKRSEMSDKLRALCTQQNKGEPIKISEFLETSKLIKDSRSGVSSFEGFGEISKTISYSDILGDKYQSLIKFDLDFLNRLKEINSRRNQLHFYINRAEGYRVDSHIKIWKEVISKIEYYIDGYFENDCFMK